MLGVKVFLILGLAMAFVAADEEHVLGGIKKLEGDELKDAEETLSSSLTKLAAGDGPNYKISKIISATRQVVSGSLYKLDTELIDGDNVTKKCKVSIWSQPWLPDGIEVTFDCEGEEKLVKKHSA